MKGPSKALRNMKPGVRSAMALHFAKEALAGEDVKPAGKKKMINSAKVKLKP